MRDVILIQLHYDEPCEEDAGITFFFFGVVFEKIPVSTISGFVLTVLTFQVGVARCHIRRQDRRQP